MLQKLWDFDLINADPNSTGIFSRLSTISEGEVKRNFPLKSLKWKPDLIFCLDDSMVDYDINLQVYKSPVVMLSKRTGTWDCTLLPSNCKDMNRKRWNVFQKGYDSTSLQIRKWTNQCTLLQ